MSSLMVLLQTHFSLLSSAIHITICAKIQFLIRTFESRGSGSAPVLASNIQFSGYLPKFVLGKLGMFQRPNCCNFCDIFGKSEG